MAVESDERHDDLVAHLFAAACFIGVLCLTVVTLRRRNQVHVDDCAQAGDLTPYPNLQDTPSRRPRRRISRVLAIAICFAAIAIIAIILWLTSLPAHKLPRHVPCAFKRGSSLKAFQARASQRQFNSSLPASSKESAQDLFDSALILAFSFNHAQAARLFESALRLDPQCFLCAWGIAFSAGPYVNKVPAS
jgi:hypothetical protein